MKEILSGANPYMPLWEHVPDGEPRVFTHNGETRVYVYGSHDTAKTEYCGNDYVVWSAPVDDLTSWRYDGVCFSADNILYAPDVVKKNDTYYMYIAMNKGENIYVAESSSPTGPFLNPRKTDFGFDIGVLVDDDNRCYAYWGFLKCFCCEINDDMATIKDGTFKTNMIPHCEFRTNSWDKINSDKEFCYFEAASIRKIKDKYVFIYSKRISDGDPCRALKPNTNCYLDYAYSTQPLSGWVHGGTISNSSGAIIEKKDGTKKRAYQTCNNHGSLAEINGKYYIFYHRGTGTNGYSRQAMLEPCDVCLYNDKLYIGKIEYGVHHIPLSCEEVEMTSQGAYTDGLPYDKIISAGYACYIDSPDDSKRAYIKPVYDQNNFSSPIVNIKPMTTVGFKYINFHSAKNISVRIKPLSDTKIDVLVDAPFECGGTKIASVLAENTNNDYKILTAKLDSEISGKHALYFSFYGECEFDFFTFE